MKEAAWQRKPECLRCSPEWDRMQETWLWRSNPIYFPRSWAQEACWRAVISVSVKNIRKDPAQVAQQHWKPGEAPLDLCFWRKLRDRGTMGQVLIWAFMLLSKHSDYGCDQHNWWVQGNTENVLLGPVRRLMGTDSWQASLVTSMCMKVEGMKWQDKAVSCPHTNTSLPPSSPPSSPPPSISHVYTYTK